jgi:hypothetical protein
MTGRTRATFLAAAVFGVALVCRLVGLSEAVSGHPEVPPADDLYHAKRIVHTALRFPRLLDFDSLRGTRGAFCPWPPLYDWTAGALAHASGAETPEGVLALVCWIPPIVSSLFAALVAFVTARRLGLLSGAAAGFAVGLSWPILEGSRFGSLDHHFLEPLFASAVACATAAILERGGDARRAILLGCSIAAGLLVQPALLVAAALCAAAFLLFASGAGPLGAGAAGFGLAILPVAAYRVTRAPGFPESAWYLGAPHIAALAGAAAALAVAAVLTARGVPGWRARLLGVLFGGTLVLGVPAAARTFLGGARFLGGDPWLDQIQEFRPLLAGRTPMDAVAVLGGGLLLFPLAAVSAWRRGPGGKVLTLFAVAYVGATVLRERFACLAAALLVYPAAFLIESLWRRGRRALAFGAAAALVLPSVVAVSPSLFHPAPIVPLVARPALRVARLLRGTSPRAGRVLAPWSWGHVIDVVGERGAVLDNFGSWIGEPEFSGAISALLSTREERLAEWCRRNGVEWVVFDNPLLRLPATAAMLELPGGAYLRPPSVPGGAPHITHLMQATVWWRAYFERGRARPERGMAGAPLRLFVPVYDDPDPSWEPAPFAGPALSVWRLAPG